jgi:hypothetical protein
MEGKHNYKNKAIRLKISDAQSLGKTIMESGKTIQQMSVGEISAVLKVKRVEEKIAKENDEMLKENEKLKATITLMENSFSKLETEMECLKSGTDFLASENSDLKEANHHLHEEKVVLEESFRILKEENDVNKESIQKCIERLGGWDEVVGHSSWRDNPFSEIVEKEKEKEKEEEEEITTLMIEGQEYFIVGNGDVIKVNHETEMSMVCGHWFESDFGRHLRVGHNGKMGIIKWEKGHPRHPKVAQEIVKEVLDEIVDQVVDDNPSMNGMTT